MKSGVLLWFLLVVFALPAHAGRWAIRETETAIFAEYSDDAAAADNPTGEKSERQPASRTEARPVATMPAAVDAAAQPQAAGGQPDEGSSVRAPRTEQDEARRRLKSEKRAARRGVRQPGAEQE